MTTALAVAGSTLVVAPSSTAADTWSPVVVSRDGHTWTRSLAGPLFARRAVLVPGDAMTRTFVVRNQSGGAAVVAVHVDRANATAADGLRFAASSGSGWVRVGAYDDEAVLRLPMAAGDVRRVRVRVGMDPRADNESMGARDRVRIRVTQTPVRAG